MGGKRSLAQIKAFAAKLKYDLMKNPNPENEELIKILQV